MSKLWSYVNERSAAASHESDGPKRPERRGRVLRVKDGYNPNSSSIGTAIPGYLFFAAASGAVAVLLLNLRSAVDSLLRKRSQRQPAHDEPPERDDEDGD